MNSLFELIEKGIDRSRKQLLLAGSGEWEKFLELDDSRQKLLRSIKLDGAGLSDEDDRKLREQMPVLIELNGQLEIICKQHRLELANKLKKMRKGSKASKAYSQ